MLVYILTSASVMYRSKVITYFELFIFCFISVTLVVLVLLLESSPTMNYAQKSNYVDVYL